MRVDAHQHFWSFNLASYAWIDESMQVLRRDYLPPALHQELNAHAFDGSVAVQARQTLEESLWLLSLAAERPYIKGVVGWVDLCAATVQVELERLAAYPKFRGVRHIAQSEPDDFLLRPAFQRGIAALERFALAYDILIYPHQLEAACALAARFPRQRFVLDHLGKPRIRQRELKPWRARLRQLSRLPNVWCKLSGLVTEAELSLWKPVDLLPYLDVALECFGPTRLLFGSDWPVCLLAAPYSDVLAVVEDYTARLSLAERAAILGDNAVRFYGLELSVGRT